MKRTLNYLIEKIKDVKEAGRHTITYKDLREWFKEKHITGNSQIYLVAQLEKWLRQHEPTMQIRFSYSFIPFAKPNIPPDHPYYDIITQLYPQFAHLENTVDIIDIMTEEIEKALQTYPNSSGIPRETWCWWYICKRLTRVLARIKIKDNDEEEEHIPYSPWKQNIIITSFFQEITKYPLLNQEKEKLLAEIINTYKIEAKKRQLLKKLEKNEPLTPEEQRFLDQYGPPVDENTFKHLEKEAEHARNVLITSNIKLVIHIAKHYATPQHPLEELIQEGILGLFKAIERFDPSRGNKFSTYATWWIRQSIERYIVNNTGIIRVPVHVHDYITKYEKTVQSLKETLGREPTIEEIAKAMNVSIEKVQDIQRIIKRKVIYINTDPESGFVYQIPDYHKWSSPEYELYLKDLKNYVLNNILSILSEREREILKLRYGLEDGKERSLEEVAYHFGITRERVRQIIQKAKKKLRSPRIRKKLEKLYRLYIG